MRMQRHVAREFQSTPSVWRETDKHRNRVRPRLFQSTPSVWRETIPDRGFFCNPSISIHSLRVEGD